MKRTKREPAVDCVAWKRRAQARIHADTQGLSAAEQIEYFRRRAAAGALGAWWAHVSRRNSAPLAIGEEPGKYSR